MVILSVHSGKPLLFLPNPCNGKLLQSLHGVSLIMSLRHFPTSFSSRPFHHCPFWVSHGCADTAGWGGAICLEVIPTYWKPSPHVFFGQVSLPASSGPCLLACNTQAPHEWWLPHTDVVESTTVSWQVQKWWSLSSTVFQQQCESKGWALPSETSSLSAFRQEGMRSVFPHQHFSLSCCFLP